MPIKDLSASLTLGLLLCAMVAAGCHPHVALRAPARNDPVESRLEAYQRLRPRLFRRVTYRGEDNDCAIVELNSVARFPATRDMNR